MTVNLKGFEMSSVSGSPLQGLTVQAYAALDTQPNAGAIVASTTTDLNGMWTFTGLADGDYDVKVTAPGINQVKWYKGNSQISVTQIRTLPMRLVGVKAVRTTAQSIATSTTTNIALNAADIYDSDNVHDIVTNNDRLICAIAGTYLVTGGFAWATGAGNVRGAMLGFNGASVFAEDYKAPAGAGQPTAHNISGRVQLAVGQYVTLQAFQDSGGALNTSVFFSPAFLAMERIGP